MAPEKSRDDVFLVKIWLWFSNGIVVGNVMKHGLVKGDGVCATEILGRSVSRELGTHPKWLASFIRGMEVIEPYTFTV